MKLASLRQGRDGCLVVVDSKLRRAVKADGAGMAHHECRHCVGSAPSVA